MRFVPSQQSHSLCNRDAAMNSFQAETPLMIMDAHLAHQVYAAAAAVMEGKYGREKSGMP